MKALVALASLFVIGSSALPELRDTPEALVSLLDRYCLAPDGDHRMTWHRAEQDGFTLIGPEEFPGLRLLGANGDTLRAFRKAEDQHELRVLTAASWVQGLGQGRSYFRYCWVSATTEHISELNRELSRHLNGRYFRAEKTFVYAWIPLTDNTREFVPRRIYMRNQLSLARERGMRQVTVREYGENVFIGYSSPRDEATYRDFDWSGPDPVPRPE